MSILRTLTPALGAALAIAAPASAGVTHLPTVERALTAASASTTYVAPMSGFVTVQLGAAGGDWDLALRDARTGATLARSAAFGSQEVAQAWVTAGQRLVVAGTRTSGSPATARVAIDFANAAQPRPTRQSMVRIPRVSQRVYDQLTSKGIDLEEMSIGRNWMDVFVSSPAKLSVFERLGIPYKVRVADLAARDARSRAREAARARAGVRGLVPSGRTTYRRLADFQTDMKAITDAHPDFARPVTIGTTFQGRAIQGIEFSKDVARTDDGKPTYFLMGVHHAREWPSAEMAMEFMTLLAQKFGATDPDGQRVTKLLESERIVVVPIINVDGFAASRGENVTGTDIPDAEDELGFNGLAEPIVAGGAFAYRRKNCDGALPGATQNNAAARAVPCYYQYGVDPNRNYGFDWGGPGASTDPTTQTYRGTGPWSEPETQAVWRYSQTHPVTTLITMHTIAALVLRSPGLKTNGLAPDESLLKELGDKIGANTGYTSQYGWQLYDTTGTTEDWNYGAVGTLGYTIEIGPSGGDFHGDYKEAVEDQWVGPAPNFGKKITGGGLKEALLTAGEYAMDPRTHVVVSGTGTPGATLRVKKEFTTDSSPLCTFAQGLIRAGNSPADCLAPGTLGTIKTPDMLDYTITVPQSGTFTWHITQSTRPFKGYTYDTATKKPKANGTKEAWTLTCSVGGTVVKTQSLVVERGEAPALGNVCA